MNKIEILKQAIRHAQASGHLQRNNTQITKIKKLRLALKQAYAQNDGAENKDSSVNLAQYKNN